MENFLNDPNLLATPGHIIDVRSFNPGYTGNVDEKKQAKHELKENIELMTELQDKLYAHNRFSVLIIFQAMDAAGKDGTIKNVMSGLNPQGTQVFSFKTPSAEELDHDYLWRIYQRLPERGRIGIFNRSYYEEVLVVRVHPEFLLKQQLPGIKEVSNINDAFWMKRYRQINDMEKHLFENGTIVLKFFLNVSKEEQKHRFLNRIDDPARNWKFSMADVEERQHWDAYMDAYSQMLTHTSTTLAPWYVIPADNKWFMRLAVSNIIAQRLSELPLKYPVLNSIEMERLTEARTRLEGEEY